MFVDKNVPTSTMSSQIVSKNIGMSIHADKGKESIPRETGAAYSSKDEKKEALVKEARNMVSSLLEAVERDKLASPTRDTSLNFSKNALKAFASSEAVTVEKFRSSGGLRSTVIAIRKHCKSSDVVEFGCNALAVLMILDTTTVEEIAKAGAIDAVVSAIAAQASTGSDDARVSAIKTLRNLTQTEENRSRIYNAKGLEAVIEAMKNNPESPRTLSHSALVLSNLAFGDTEIKEAVGELGGISAIARGMKDHKDFQGMQARGSLALRNLCYGSERNQVIAGQSGAAEALLIAIEAYMEDREVVHQSCVALTNLSNKSDENRMAIVTAGAAGIAVRLMKMYTESVTVHDDAISIIRNIAVGSEDARTEVGVTGGVGCICRALDKFSKDGKMVDKACMALRYLCFLPDNRVRMREGRGVELVVNVLKTRVNSADSVEHALLAVGNATFESEESKAIVGRCGGIAVIIKAIEQHRLSASIQEHGCRVLRNLADGFELNRRLEGECGGVSTGVFAMMGYPENASVQEQACAMLLNMAGSPGNLEKMEQADVARLAEKAISMHSKHRGVLLQGGTLLDKLNGFDVGGGDGAGQPTLGENGGRRGLRSLLRKFSRD